LPPPEIILELVSDIPEENLEELKLGEQVTIDALTNTDNGLFTWSHADTLLGETAIVQPTETTFYEVTVMDTLTFCTAKGLIQLFVDQSPRVYIPNIFSPNEDGNNDHFFIFGGSDVVNIESLRIFARNGQMVYEQTNLASSDESRGWDGTINGEPMNTGVFVYVAEITFIDGRTDVVKGDVLLMR